MPADPGKRNSMSEVTRRKFIGVATGTAGAMLIKPGLVRGTDANSAVRVGLLGCGGRGTEAGILRTGVDNRRVCRDLSGSEGPHRFENEMQAVRATLHAHDDDALLAQLRAGDELAFGALVDRHRPWLVRLCTRLLDYDAHAAEDVLDDLLLEGVLVVVLRLLGGRSHRQRDESAANASHQEPTQADPSFPITHGNHPVQVRVPRNCATLAPALPIRPFFKADRGAFAALPRARIHTRARSPRQQWQHRPS